MVDFYNKQAKTHFYKHRPCPKYIFSCFFLPIREQFPGFYAQFRELNKAIGASGDGNLEYIYDNLMITEVTILSKMAIYHFCLKSMITS